MQSTLAFQMFIPIFGGYYVSQWVNYNALKASFLLSATLFLLPILSVFLSYDFFTWMRETIHIGWFASLVISLCLHALLNQVMPLLAYVLSVVLFSLQEAFLQTLWSPIYINRVCWSFVLDNQRFLRKNVWLQLDHFATTHPFLHAQLCVFIGVSMLAHVCHSVEYVWDYISADTERFLPLSIAATRYFVKVSALGVFLSAVTIFTVRPIFLISADAIFGLASFILVANIARYCPIWSSSGFYTISIYLGIYLLSFYILLPALGVVSNQGYLFEALRLYYNWASRINCDPGPTQVMRLFGSLAACGIAYLLGNMFSVHWFIYSVHGILLAFKYANHPVRLITAFLTTLFFYISSFTWPIIVGLPMTALISMGVHILTEFLVVPILWPLAGLLASIFLFTGLNRILTSLDMAARRFSTFATELFASLIHFCFFEQSSFDPLVFWILMTVYALTALFKFSMLAVPWKFDLESYFLHFLEKYLQFHTLERSGYLFVSSTSLYTPMKGWNMSWMNFTVHFPEASGNPYFFASCLLGAIAIVFIILNLLVLCGKRLGDHGGILTSVIVCSHLFLHLRVHEFFNTRYQIVSDVIALEGALLVVFTIGLCHYTAIKWLSINYYPHNIRIASLPYELLVIWQTWAARLVWKQALLCYEIVSILWLTFSGRRQKSSPPKYVRPRRYV